MKKKIASNGIALKNEGWVWGFDTEKKREFLVNKVEPSLVLNEERDEKKIKNNLGHKKFWVKVVT